jgi:N6-adenosine-specific RNA methylase IME4
MSDVPAIPEFLDRRNWQDGKPPASNTTVLSETGLSIADTVAFEEWQSIGQQLQRMERSVMWWIGDWLRHGERQWGEMYAQALDATDYSYSHLSKAKWVAEQFDFCDRSQNLSWTHHSFAASLPPADRSAVLAEAEREGWSVRELKAAINQRKNVVGTYPSSETGIVADLHEAIAKGLRFGTIYADPPWLYDNQGTRAATGNHYGGMTVEEICALPVADLVAPDAHLHLWTTNGFLFECPRIFAAWGFEFRSSFIWCKTEMGIGNYWRNSHEILLTAIRGSAKRFNDHTLRSWIECSRGRHSGKPEQVRNAIERASPGPYLELFARSPSRGWKVWGNEVERGLLFQDVQDEVA